MARLGLFRQFFGLSLVLMSTSAAVGACGGAAEGEGAARARGGSSGSAGSQTGGSGAISAAGGASGTGNGIEAGSVGGSAGSSAPWDAACATSTYQAEEIPLDMFIMFDQSGSMDPSRGGAWNTVRDAIFTFVDSLESADIGVGIGYFPMIVPCTSTSIPGCECNLLGRDCPTDTSICNATDYSTPDVPIQVLPGVAQAIKDSLNAHTPGGGTPTHPALQGAMQYALQYAVVNPGRKTIVVLATDGAPNHCNSNVNNVSTVAAAGYANNPSLLTFVIGIGNTGNLDAIAQAGGTGSALIVNTATAGQDFLRAMNQIRGRALACTFQVPAAPAGETFDPNQVNVQFAPPGGTAELVYNVRDASQCDPALGGWYYDNPAHPTEIRTCDVTCQRLEAERGRVDIALGCRTETIPK